MKSTAHRSALQQTLLVQTVERGHDRGIGQSRSEFVVKIANAGFASPPDAFHQLRFEATQLLHRSSRLPEFAFKPHEGAPTLQSNSLSQGRCSLSFKKNRKTPVSAPPRTKNRVLGDPASPAPDQPAQNVL